MSDDICICDKDQDGRCQRCLDLLQGSARKLIEVQAEYLQKIQTLKLASNCEACSGQYLDYAISLVLKEVFVQYPPSVSITTAQALVGVITAQGRPSPLTKKVTVDGCKAQGVEPPPTFQDNT